MKKAVKLAIPIVIIILSIAILLLQNSQKKICFQENCIKAEIADSLEKRAQGLMYRTSLQENEGMFFIFDESKVYPFWMKNTLIPLDIIWLDENLKVVDIITAQPCEKDPCPSYRPEAQALYVLEINAGEAASHGIQIGSTMTFR